MNRFSPQHIQQIIKEEDRPQRLAAHPPEMVEAVFRYGAVVGSQIVHFASQGRCMDEARRRILAEEEAGRSFSSGLVLVADELTCGKGRFDRVWHAPAGGLWLSVVLANTLLPEMAGFYPLAAGIACCEALRQYGVDARLKWVNDVHVGGRKIAGILAESFRSKVHGEEFILIGVGVNINNLEFPSELSDSAVSLKGILGRDEDLALFGTRLLAKFVWNTGLLHYEEAQSMAQGEEPRAPILLASWERLSDTIGRTVWFGYDVVKKPLYKARVLGLDESGGLLLKNLADGRTTVVTAGEILYV